MHLAGGPPGAQPHPQMMQPQQQQQLVGHCVAEHMMNSSELMGGQSLPCDQILPWFDNCLNAVQSHCPFPAEMVHILSSENGPHALQVSIVFAALHFLHSTSELHMHA